MLAFPVAGQGLEPVAGRNPEVIEAVSRIQKRQFSKRRVLDVAWKAARAPTGPDLLRFAITEASDHKARI